MLTVNYAARITPTPPERKIALREDASKGASFADDICATKERKKKGRRKKKICRK